MLSKSNDVVNTRAVPLITFTLIMGAELFFRSLDPNSIFTWLIAKEDFSAYVICESFRFSIIFLPVKFCVRKGKGSYQSCVLCKYEYCCFEVGYFGVSVLRE